MSEEESKRLSYSEIKFLVGHVSEIENLSEADRNELREEQVERVYQIFSSEGDPEGWFLSEDFWDVLQQKGFDIETPISVPSDVRTLPDAVKFLTGLKLPVKGREANLSGSEFDDEQIARLRVNLKDLNFTSLRIENLLGHYPVLELVQKSEEQLLGIENVGRVTIKDIKNVLASEGL